MTERKITVQCQGKPVTIKIRLNPEKAFDIWEFGTPLACERKTPEPPKPCDKHADCFLRKTEIIIHKEVLAKSSLQGLFRATV
jgi:hypothetical protein